MEHLQPIDLLKQRLNEYEKALQKSFEAFNKGTINKPTHEQHKGNLLPLIFKFKQSISILENWVE